MLQGLAHRQQASMSMHAMKMEELDNKIAETDQRLAIHTRSLADVSTEASTAQKEEMVLKAEWQELSAELEEHQKENLALCDKIKRSRQAITAEIIEQRRMKRSFHNASAQLNKRIRKGLQEHPGSAFVNDFLA
ncbi:hypothetical protein CVIRNUC_005379 [Coccomyxa viridis]|uniref:Uncharacterized protein n=1 Tax=Coccomyxa viridis TaxID=1274662 RepID=A0AAV1I5R3_9CHLO|nr:hypothetical protein CVIRNUC_005379 [Coccomyxa viridis]